MAEPKALPQLAIAAEIDGLLNLVSPSPAVRRGNSSTAPPILPRLLRVSVSL